MEKILLVGCGKMGGALLRGWLDTSVARRFYVLKPTPLSSEFLPVPNIAHFKNSSEINCLSGNFDVVLLAVKPQVMDRVCEEISSYICSETLILSIAAGKTLEGYERHFGKDQPIVRTMPNTPAAIGKGAVVAVANRSVTNVHQAQVSDLLQVSGALHWIEDEALMDAVTALSGSGPAYVFYLIEILGKAGQALGLEAGLADALARQTVIGAAALAEHDPGLEASVLRENVTSPGGTTAAALDVLMNGELEMIFKRALEAAQRRGRELSG